MPMLPNPFWEKLCKPNAEDQPVFRIFFVIRIIMRQKNKIKEINRMEISEMFRIATTKSVSTDFDKGFIFDGCGKTCGKC